MSLSTLHAHRTPFAPPPCSFGSPPPPLPPSVFLSTPPPSSASSPETAMASPTTVYSGRHSLPRPLHPCPPPAADHAYAQQQYQHQHHQQHQQQHHHQHHQHHHQPHHHHHLPARHGLPPPPPPQPLSGLLADMVPARPKGLVRFPPFEDGQDAVTRQAVQTFRISPFGNIQEYCRHIPYMSNKKTFFDKTRREGFEVFQYVFKLPGEDKEYHVMWDYNIGLVRMTPFFRCCNYGKTAPAKMLNDNPGLRDITHSITGGAIVAQGYWMPYECAKAMCATFCYHVAGALVPLFGPDFPGQCVPPHATEFERKVIDPALIAAATRHAEDARQMMVAEGGSGSTRNAPRPEAPPPPPPPPPPSSSFRSIRAMPMLPPPVQVVARSPVVAPAVSPDYSMPPPRRAAAAAAAAADGLLPSPVEHDPLPPVSYITSLPPLSPGRPEPQALLGRDELLWQQQQQHYGYHHRPYADASSRAPSPLPSLARRGPEQQQPSPRAASFAYAAPPGHALGRPPQEPRAPSDSYPSPPPLRSALQQTPPAATRDNDGDDNERSPVYGGGHHDRTVDRKHRRDSSSGHAGSRHRKRPSNAIDSSRRPPSVPSLPRRSGGGSSSTAAAAAAASGRHRLPGRRIEGLPRTTAAAAMSRHAPPPQAPPHPSTATDTAAAALLVNFSVKVRARSGSGSGDDAGADAAAARPRGGHSIASLLCSDEDN